VTKLAKDNRPIFGLLGFACGLVALLIVLAHFSAGTLEPKASKSFQLGEVAAEIKDSARRKLSGMPEPAPKPAPWDADRMLKAATMMLAGLALTLSAIGLIRREVPYPSMSAIAIGIGVLLVPVAIWMAVVCAGLVLLVALIRFLDRSAAD
jgi:hypothetical protein